LDGGFLRLGTVVKANYREIFATSTPPLYAGTYGRGMHAMPEQYIIRLKNLTKSFEETKVLKGIDLDIRDKEFVTFLGPSGCGKTTTLRIIGGFTEPDAGDVFFEGKRINDLPPYKRQVNTIFQRYALFPHLDVFENVAFGLRLTKTPEKEIQKRAAEMLNLVNLKGFQGRRIEQLSGGQQQRVAIARALVNHPKVLLLDEPLGALDLKLRKEMQAELKSIQQRMGITFIYVTHDQEEALTMSDTIVVMRDGEIQQIGTPQDVYNEPKNAFVADFIGESNIVDAVMPEDKAVTFHGKTLPCVDVGFAPGEAVDMVIRPEDLKVVPLEEGQFTGKVQMVIFKGVHYEMRVLDETGFLWTIHSTICEDVGKEIGMRVAPFDIHIMKKMKKRRKKAKGQIPGGGQKEAEGQK